MVDKRRHDKELSIKLTTIAVLAAANGTTVAEPPPIVPLSSYGHSRVGSSSGSGVSCGGRRSSAT